MRTWVAASVIAASATTASALDLFYTEPLGGVYVQDWYGEIIGPDRVRGVLVFVRGDGKSGDFFGVLSVDCDVAARSEWVSEGGYLRSDAVPAAAIDVIRDRACSAS